MDWDLGGVAAINNDIIKYICDCCTFTHCVITDGEPYTDNLSDGLGVQAGVFQLLWSREILLLENNFSEIAVL